MNKKLAVCLFALISLSAFAQTEIAELQRSTTVLFEDFNATEFSKSRTTEILDYDFYSFENGNHPDFGQICIQQKLTQDYYKIRGLTTNRIVLWAYESAGEKVERLLWQHSLGGYLYAVKDDFAIIRIDDIGGYVYDHYINAVTGKSVVTTHSLLGETIRIPAGDYVFYAGIMRENTHRKPELNRDDGFYDRTIVLFGANRLLQKVHVYRKHKIASFEGRLSFNFTDSLRVDIKHEGKSDIILLPFEKMRLRVDKQSVESSNSFFLVPAEDEWYDDYLARKDYRYVSSKTPKDELRLLRNEIFARHGHVFKSEDLRGHFSRTSWYEPIPNIHVSLEDFTEDELEMFDRIRKLEKE